VAGIKERVKGFLDSWPKVKKQLEEAIGDGDKSVDDNEGNSGISEAKAPCYLPNG
jgi:hypothetical protein